MIKRLIWTIWTPMSSVLKKANKLNLSLSLRCSWPIMIQLTNAIYRSCVRKELLRGQLQWFRWSWFGEVKRHSKHDSSINQDSGSSLMPNNTRHYLNLEPMLTKMPAGIILGLRPANERWRYHVMSSLIGLVHSPNDLCTWCHIASVGHKLTDGHINLTMYEFSQRCKMKYVYWSTLLIYLKIYLEFDIKFESSSIMVLMNHISLFFCAYSKLFLHMTLRGC